MERSLISEFLQARDLKHSERWKSIDYWEGYTKAVSEIYFLTKKHNRTKRSGKKNK